MYLIEKPMIQVVAAVIRTGNRFLLGQRPHHKRHGGLWEFPGGKIESNENVFEAIARELKEEMGLIVTSIGQCLHSVDDPGSVFSIEFTETFATGEPRAIEHQAIGWFTLTQLNKMNLAPSDRLFLECLVKHHEP
jgi:8-oxo-dGTP diphosphatase